jgi:hypothetical protein
MMHKLFNQLKYKHIIKKHIQIQVIYQLKT